MARYKTVIEVSAPGANANLANIVAGAAAGAKIRRLTFGVRTSGVPTSQNVTISATRATARGTASTTKTPIQMDPNSPAAAITGVDTAWSVQPTLAANPMDEWSFNTQNTLDIPSEFLEEYIVSLGTANGICFQNVANAFPASHTLTITVEHEE